MSSNVTLLNLQTLDLSHNALTVLKVASFIRHINLRHLDLSWNFFDYFTPLNEDPSQSVSLQILENLDILRLSGLPIQALDLRNRSSFIKTKTLDVSFGKFTSVSSPFSDFQEIEHINMEGSSVEIFPRDVYKGLVNLVSIKSSNFQLCCPQLMPSHMLPKNCIAPSDEISSCDNLLRSDAYRTFLWAFAFVAVMGK